jgi:alpha-ketoglutarate-dependent taurine dioxygenase
MQTAPLSNAIRESRIDVHGLTVEQTFEKMKPALESRRLCLIRGFPTDPLAFLKLLDCFGEPLTNYSSLSDLEKDDPNTKINRVRYKRGKAGGPKSVHYIDGELKPHSARSWRMQRPRYFSMLMVDPGWRDTDEGQRGESVVLEWRYMFQQLAAQDGDTFERHFERLRTMPVHFEANNVREDTSRSPLCYPLPDAADRFDVGVRLKQDLQQNLPKLREQFDDFDGYRDAVDYLVQATKQSRYQARFPLDSGDLIIVDNNRFAHGRCNIVGEREVDGETVFNPRELWSVCIS